MLCECFDCCIVVWICEVVVVGVDCVCYVDVV